ncbi:hypothetical protein DTO013E5_9849 [Penicillium roqueforti]|uniref:Genomic scaffold, ProqFM164S03 n=1 Tax=Penicillium roqueforti (strain FM164) TaxID=1365484 RepID=W6QBI1_PENRF|nr:uncharacterized protein LCP9604111_3017 [Penicillium roqueforti]CDM33381.1 unnamed protein product [Penicillium roqueforti FM164]KAF9250813.1 hypothetical protein LCP9604111_3017 [Penicillium roqueforti]KAI1830879.1 hypothetical protein CBS147337_8236 [Penicillium roqueforti]KAI2681434.1 hypothetical protein CBS147355_2644 [Penicillium roqueforti]KAI2704119.1 hypothetical protein CBS147372_2588 [Penicillium roqueforti]
MSADLLAEFGQAPAPDNRPEQQPSQYHKNSSFDDENIDFFGSSGSVQHNKRPNPTPGAASQLATPAASWQGPGRQEFDIPLNPHSDVLFDAAFDTPTSDADDDWGEFEVPDSDTLHAQSTLVHSSTAISPKPEPRQDGPQASKTIDLLDSLSLQDFAPAVKLHSNITKKKYPLEPDNSQNQATWEDDSFGDWGDFADVPASQPPPKVAEKKTRPPTKPPVKATKPLASTWDDDTFDDWDDFSDGPSVKPVPKSKPTTPSPAPTSSVSGTTAPAATVRPTNIPPPSILLELFLDVFENLQKDATLAKSQLRSSAPLSSSSSSTVSTTALNIHNVLQSAARVIAGRSLRWKRDTILSQSMRIGPARSGKAGGMKLNSVNKQENIKEEQDAVDVLTTWRERAAIFNAILQAAGQRPIPTIPDPSALKVITARADQGALKASHPCALCSLKRDERVLRVDEQGVQDSFGEWWTEHWGHTACRQFWETNRNLLGQR